MEMITERVQIADKTTILNRLEDETYYFDIEDAKEIVQQYPNACLKDVVSDESVDLIEYNKTDYTIHINQNKMLAFCHDRARELMEHYRTDPTSYSFYVNFYYMFLLLRELEKARQLAVYNFTKNSDDLFVYLYELSERIKNERPELSYLTPMEIMANNRGIDTARSLITHSKIPPREWCLIYLQYLKNMLANYDMVDDGNVLAPIDLLWVEDESVDVEKIYQLLENTNISYTDRFNLGLWIDTRHFARRNRQMKRLDKKKKR